MLSTRFPNATDTLMDGVEILSAECSAVEAFALEQASKPKGGA